MALLGLIIDKIHMCIVAGQGAIAPCMYSAYIECVPTLLHIKIIQILPRIQGAIVDSPLIYKLKVKSFRLG